MQKIHWCSGIVAAALAMSVAPSEQALAAEAAADNGGLTEVVVTARKREETLIAVPLSVQAFSAAELERSGITDLKSLQTTAGFSFPPQITTAAAGRAFGNLVFRGLAGASSLPQDASGSLFIDGIFISGGAASVNTADVERVEVLKGPQNAFFGRSTFGGLVNFITGNPSKTFSAKADAELTDRGTNNFDLSVEGPLFGDKLRGRLMVLSNHKAGQYRATDGGVLGDENTKSVTGTLYATPSDNLWVRARGHYQQDDDSSAALAYIKGTNCAGYVYPGMTDTGANAPFQINVPAQCGPVPTLSSGNPRVIVNDNTVLLPSAIGPQINNSLGDPFLSSGPTLKHMGLRRDTLRLSAQGGYSFANNYKLDVNAGYNKSNATTAWDLDRTAVLNFANAQPILTSDMTLDARLSSDSSRNVRVLIGASYFRSAFRVSQIDLNAAFGATAYTLNLGNYVNSNSHVPAAYASVDWDILDNLTFSGDVRYQQDKVINIVRATGVEITNSTKKTLPRLTLSFKPDKDSNFYVTYAEGVQPLALNAGFVNASADGKRYLQSIFPTISEYSAVPTLKSFEIGAKQKLFDGRLQYTIAAYNSKWDNRATTTFVFNPLSCNGPPLEQNTPRCPLGVAGSGQTLGNNAKVKGIELSATGNLTDRWTAGLNLTYNDAKWDYYANSAFGPPTNIVIGPVAPSTAIARRFDGNKLANTPDLAGSINTTYRAPLFGDWEWFARGDLRYQGKMWDSDLNITHSDPFYRLNLRFGMEKERTSLELYVNNVTNDTHWDFVYRLADLSLVPLVNFSTQGLGAGLPSKRELGVRASFKFD